LDAISNDLSSSAWAVTEVQNNPSSLTQRSMLL
jgi:hypothetical protein